MMFIVGSAFGSGEADDELLGLSGIHSVTVKAQSLDVELIGADFGRLEMSLATPDDAFGARGFRVRHERFGDRLNVWIETDWLFGWARTGKLRLKLPRAVQARVETVSGSISARGLSGGTWDLRTVSGGIRLAEVSGGIKARTVSGSILGDGVDFVSDADFSSVSGRVDIQSDSPLELLRFDLSSVSGRIVVGNIAAGKGLRMGFIGPLVRAHTVSGSLLFR